MAHFALEATKRLPVRETDSSINVLLDSFSNYRFNSFTSFFYFLAIQRGSGARHPKAKIDQRDPPRIADLQPTNSIILPELHCGAFPSSS
jgi:hypothetical protein